MPTWLTFIELKQKIVKLWFQTKTNTWTKVISTSSLTLSRKIKSGNPNNSTSTSTFSQPDPLIFNFKHLYSSCFKKTKTLASSSDRIPLTLNLIPSPCAFNAIRTRSEPIHGGRAQEASNSRREEGKKGDSEKESDEQ